MEFISNVNYVALEQMTVISGIKAGDEPENEIILLMKQLAKEFNLSPIRAFGFDSPVGGKESLKVYRGYEYWYSLSKEDLEKLPSKNSFKYNDTTINIKHIPKMRYATLRIIDPFKDVFGRVPIGWTKLDSWVENHDYKALDFVPVKNGYSLEEVKEINGITVMDIFVPVRLS